MSNEPEQEEKPVLEEETTQQLDSSSDSDLDSSEESDPSTNPLESLITRYLLGQASLSDFKAFGFDWRGPDEEE